MFESIQSFLRNILTENDNQTYEIVRVLWAVAVVLGLTLETLSVFWHFNFDLQAYGLGTGTLLGAGGIATALKAHVERKE